MIQESAGSTNVTSYSAFDSASWAITTNKLSSVLGDHKQVLYNNYIRKCDAAVEAKVGHVGDCTINERKRLTMNQDQPASVYNYTKTGYAKVKTPPELFKAIKEFFETNRDKSKTEWKEHNVYHNTWDSPPTFIDLHTSRGLARRIEDEVKPILEEWTGQRLSPVSTYGIRLYHDGSILAPHVDRMPLVTSVIIQVDQDVDEPWPLEVYGHDGTATNVTMEPGDMVLYESHSVIHGRPFPMKGNWFANCFIHYEPIEPIEGESLYDPDVDLPPYLVRDSKWEEEWMKTNPSGWKGSMGQSIRGVVVHGNMYEFQSYISKKPKELHHKDVNGWTVLHEAARAGRVDMMKIILQHDVDKDLLTRGGQSPLKLAKNYLPQDHEMIQYLESIGARDISPGRLQEKKEEL